MAERKRVGSERGLHGTLSGPTNNVKRSGSPKKSVTCNERARATSVMRLHITVKDKNGKVLTETNRDSDMYLDQWQAIIAALFKNLGVGTYTGATTFSCKDTGGSSRTLGGASGSSSPFFAVALEGLASEVQVQVGTGTSTAIHTDYALTNAISGATTYPTSITTSNPSGNILYVSFSATITIAAGATVSEAVVTLVVYDSGGTQRTLAITHDVFTGVVVPAGGSITLNYTLQYNSS